MISALEKMFKDREVEVGSLSNMVARIFFKCSFNKISNLIKSFEKQKGPRELKALLALCSSVKY